MKFIVIAVVVLLGFFFILPDLITVLQNLAISLSNGISLGSLLLLILALSVVLFIGYCTISVLFARGKKIKEGLDSFKSPSIVKIVTPIVTSTEHLVTKTYEGGKQIVSTIIETVKKGEHVDYCFKKSRKEKSMDKKYNDYTTSNHLKRMSFIERHFKNK